MSHGKKYLASAAKRTHSEQVSLEQAVTLVKSMAFAKFDETVEVAIRLNLKGKHTVRDTLVLPHGFRAEKKILVFAKGEKAEEARVNGAAFVGDQDLIDKIQGGWLDFDVAVATPDMMKDVGKLGQVLGRRGLMPNPKTKTVTFDVKGAVEELKKGRVEFKADKSGVVHMAIGKVSMDAEKILENARLLLQEVLRKRPADLKGEYVQSIALSSTMGPGVLVNAKEKFEGDK
ncbi:MAG: 50S ribosomal protein L1 [Spirochaetes bacterium RBG_16_67_19]|nr:MAG: 50S ribosomal protein L1 [Spirochaetes bacterium RBG_16_67_19]